MVKVSSLFLILQYLQSDIDNRIFFPTVNVFIDFPPPAEGCLCISKPKKNRHTFKKKYRRFVDSAPYGNVKVLPLAADIIDLDQ